MNLKFIRSADNRIKQMTVKELIAVLLAVSALFACLLIWPLGAMKDTRVSSSGAETNQVTGAITEEQLVAQTFIPQYGYLREIGLLVDRNQEGSTLGDFEVEIYDAAGQCQRKVFSKVYKVGDKKDGYHQFVIDRKVIPGATYLLQVRTRYTQDQPVKLLYRTKAGAGPAENQLLYYAGAELPNASLACSYTYGTPMGKKQILVYDLFFVMLFFAALSLLEKLQKRYSVFQKKAGFSVILRAAATTLLCWIGVFAVYYLLIKKAFGGSTLDWTVYGIAVLLAEVWGIYGIWHIQLPTAEVWSVSRLPGLVRVLAFAVYFSLYAPYFNSGSNYGHYLNGSYMGAAFAVVLLSFYAGKQLICWKNLIFSLLYWSVCSVRFLTLLSQLDSEQRVLRLWLYLGGWLWGIVVIMTLCRLCRKQLPAVVLPYAALTGVFFALTWIFRYEKYWPIYITVCFGLLYLQKLDPGQTLLLLRNFCQGAMLSFWYEVVFCLLYRPYHHYMYSRYPMQFSSVAITGLYLFFVLIAVLLLTMERYRTKPEWKDMWFYYLTLGTVLSYLFLSVSRTAMLGGALVILVLLLLLERLWLGRSLKKVLRVCGSMILCFCLLVPVVYTLTRCVPAVVDAPVLYPYEEFEERIYQGEEKDSNLYINVQTLLELVTGRIHVMVSGTRGSEEALPETAAAVSTVSEETGASQSNEAAGEATNGRMDIFRMYLERLNGTGHESMVLTVGDTIYAHAHNTFLQVFYDHGIFCGIVFLGLGILTLIRALLFVIVHQKEGVMTAAPLLFLLGFAAAGMTEWVFQPVIPLGFSVLFMIKPLLAPIKKQSQE